MEKQRIIKKNFEFQQIIGAQQFIKDANFVIYFIPSKTGYLEYGISVGKKIGNAVVRNKVKRQVRILMDGLLSEYGQKNYRIIVIVRPQYLRKDFKINQENLSKLLKKLK